MDVHLRILCDFDGTIAVDDVTDRLLEHFALPEWRAVEQEWLDGGIGSRACMARQVELLRARREALDGFLDSLPIDPDFAGFAALAAKLEAELVIVSDGLGYAIRRILGRYGLDRLPVFANRLEFVGTDRYRLSFPHAAPDCAKAAGTCKCRLIGGGMGGRLCLLVGDGRSDFCAASTVDMVFAKDRLLEHCRSEGVPHRAFGNFAEAAVLLDELSRWPLPFRSLEPV